MQIWENAPAFIELALSIDQHFPGYVDAYYGPEEIRARIAHRGKLPLEQLEQIATGLLNELVEDRTLAPTRKEVLTGEVQAMRTTLRLLQGEALGFLEEVYSLYGIRPSWTSEVVFEQAHQALAALLPGDGSLVERLQRFKDQFQVSAERAAPLIERLAGELQARTLQHFPLPAGERCTFEFVHEQPWGAYNWYLGRYQSRIDINLDYPIRTYTLPDYIAHEAYPGHHTEHSLKEQTLYRQGGLLEYAVQLNNTPATVLSEGIAEHALEVICSPEELVDLYQQVLAETGPSGYDGRLVYEYLHFANHSLRKVGANQLLLLHEQGAPDEEVIAYGMRYALTTQELETKSLRFAQDPLWRSYGFNYTVGYDLIAQFLASATSKEEAFARLLQEPMTPAQVLRI